MSRLRAVRAVRKRVEEWGRVYVKPWSGVVTMFAVDTLAMGEAVVVSGDHATRVIGIATGDSRVNENGDTVVTVAVGGEQ